MQTLDEPGEGRVLVVDGGASKRCALLGDILAAKMHRSGFSVSVSSIIFTSEDVFQWDVQSALSVVPQLHSSRKGDLVDCEVACVRSLKTCLWYMSYRCTVWEERDACNGQQNLCKQAAATIPANVKHAVGSGAALQGLHRQNSLVLRSPTPARQ